MIGNSQISALLDMREHSAFRSPSVERLNRRSLASPRRMRSSETWSRATNNCEPHGSTVSCKYL